MFSLSPIQIIVCVILLHYVFGQAYYPTTRKLYNKPVSNQYSQNFPKSQSQQQPKISTTNVNCPERNIRMETQDCDKYIECVDGIGSIKTCPNGLFYKTNVSFFIDPCSYIIDVNCGNRNMPQTKGLSDSCPYENGYFLPDPSKCNKYIVCSHGTPHNFNCPQGLAFDRKSYTCRWPDEVEDCDPSSYLGVTCPPVGDIRNDYNIGFEKYPFGGDCSMYYICIRNFPRLLSCPDNQLFNPNIGHCDAAENVTCENSLSIDNRSSNKKPATYRSTNNRSYQNNYQTPSTFQKNYNTKQNKRFRRLIKKVFKNGKKISEFLV